MKKLDSKEVKEDLTLNSLLILLYLLSQEILCHAESNFILELLTSKIKSCKATKEKIDKQDFIKIKNICSSKNIIKRRKRQSTEWKKIFANHVSDKG